ncbi:MAG: hypothetical protein JXR83_16840, partial [Deltaproteobacteria bacterium]|nr:hypothetical protein [Deltaproteobacteria bacterium]
MICRCRARSSVWFAVLIVLTGRSATAADEPAPQRVAVLPVSLLAAPAETGVQIRERLVETLRLRYGVDVLDQTTVDAAVAAQCGDPARWWECLDHNEKVAQIGARLGVPLVVASDLGVMGETQMLKLRVIEIESGEVLNELIELKGSDDSMVL